MNPNIDGKLWKMYQRIASDPERGISEHDVRDYLKSLGVGDGLTGRKKLDVATKRFMGEFDTRPPDGLVDWTEFVKNSMRLVPPGFANDRGELDSVQLEGTFLQMTQRRRHATAKDVSQFVGSHVSGRASLFKGAIGDVASKILMAVLEKPHNGTFELGELIALFDEIAAEQR